MGAFLSVVFFIIAGFYALGFILRLVLRVWLTRKAKEFQQKGSFGNFGGFRANYSGGTAGAAQPGSNKREGEIKVEKVEPDHRKINEKVGEYVEFDEIK